MAEDRRAAARGIEQEQRADAGGDAEADPRGDVHARGSARSGLPAPRFCPATAAAAPIRPTEVQVISENSSA